MARRTWNVEVAGKTHLVELEHSYWTSKRTIWVDQRLVHESRRALDFGSENKIEIGDQTGTVHIISYGLFFRYDLVVGGRSVTTGKAVPELLPAPGWVWLFVVALGLLVPLGGALGALLGVLGAILCYRLSRRSDLGLGARVLISLGITVGTWTVALLLGTFAVILLDQMR